MNWSDHNIKETISKDILGFKEIRQKKSTSLFLSYPKVMKIVGPKTAKHIIKN